MTPLSRRAWLVLSFVVLLSLLGCERKDPSSTAKEAPKPALRVAVTTSTRDSGLLDVLVPMFERAHRCRVDIIAVGTGAALKLGENGDADAVLVHARAAEDAFMAAGHGTRREDVMTNNFELLGPPSDPAGIKGLAPEDALKRILATKAKFASRGDKSGTHKKELALWKAAGGRPSWSGYVETGQGMGATLTIADETGAYLLADRGTYLKFREKVRLIPLAEVTKALENPYGVMTVNPAKSPKIKAQLATKWVEFLISKEAQETIRDYRIGGETLFHPLRLGGSK